MDKKVALVTGSSRGIGARIAYQLYKEGYRVAINSTGGRDRIQDYMAELMQKTDDILYIQGNVSKSEDRQRILSDTLNKFGRIDLLCNNAGIAPKIRADMLESTEESWEEVMSVNLTGMMFMTQLVANQMIKQTKAENDFEGYIVNIGSTSAWASSTNRAEYCVSKAGVSMLTTLYADRLAEFGIYVYEIRPGVIETDMTKIVREKYTNLIKRGDFPIARWGTPKDVALAVSALVEGKFKYSTGEIIAVDGGYHIRRL